MAATMQQAGHTLDALRSEGATGAPAGVEAPAGNTEHFSFDPGVMSMALQDGLLEHVQLERGLFHGQIAHTATAQTRVDWGRYNLSVLARGDLTKEMVTITLALDGAGEWRMLGQPIASGDMVVFPESGELLVTLPAQARWLSVQLPRWQLEATGMERGTAACTATTRLRGGIDATLQQALDEHRVRKPILGGQGIRWFENCGKDRGKIQDIARQRLSAT